MSTARLSDEEFVGYTFQASPERRPRLWFLDRHLIMLRDLCGWAISGTTMDIDVGIWRMGDARTDIGVAGLTVRYEHPEWTAVWRLTDVTIPTDPREAERGFGITTFGRDDDVWRLGLWPD